MKKKIIIAIILILITTISTISLTNKKQAPNISEIPSRNDTAIIPESASSTDKTYTLAEVNLHDKATDCWMTINGKVVDVTSFIASGQHPNDKIMNGCGKDATEMFTSVRKHNGGRAQAILLKSQIGILK